MHTPFLPECESFRHNKMAEAVEERRSGPKTVKDVPADAFIKAFAAHLKKSGKVRRPTWIKQCAAWPRNSP